MKNLLAPTQTCPPEGKHVGDSTKNRRAKLNFFSANTAGAHTKKPESDDTTRRPTRSVNNRLRNVRLTWPLGFIRPVGRRPSFSASFSIISLLHAPRKKIKNIQKKLESTLCFHVDSHFYATYALIIVGIVR